MLCWTKKIQQFVSNFFNLSRSVTIVESHISKLLEASKYISDAKGALFDFSVNTSC